MTPIDEKKVKEVLMKTGIKANFMNFVSRNFEIKVKNESFKYLRFHFRNFDEKLIDSQNFEIPIITEFNLRFNSKKLRNIKKNKEFVECDHSDKCSHTVFDLVSFLGEPEKDLQMGNNF